MALWPTTGQQKSVNDAVTGTSALGTSATASATPHTKGAWAQVFASTPFEATGIQVWLSSDLGVSATDTSTLLDIGIGGSGSEVVVVANVLRGHLVSGHTLALPLLIPAGSRVSVRVQSVVASKVVPLSVMLTTGTGCFDGPPGGRCTSYGANTATSNAVTIAQPGSNNIKGAWTDITAATTLPMKWLIPLIGMVAGNATFTTANYLVDFGIGPSGSEVVVVANIPANATSVEVARFMPLTIPVNIPTGTRICARYQTPTATVQQITAAALGID